MVNTLISVVELENNLERDDWVIVDCRFNLAEPEAGREAYLQGHIPGAIYAHLEADLCGPPLTDHGRHPLPSAGELAALFGRMGIGADTQVVAYDDSNGAIASRLWWMLRYMSHDAAAVVDGGWPAWLDAGLPVREGKEGNQPTSFQGSVREELLVRLEELNKVPLLIDSRAPERYRGETEPIDPVAGHIPGAVNYFYQQNWSDEGRYLAPGEIREQFATLLGDVPAAETVFHCGSGVTACANLLALAHAGLGDGRLYVGSWSEWCRDPKRPVATGEDDFTR